MYFFIVILLFLTVFCYLCGKFQKEHSMVPLSLLTIDICPLLPITDEIQLLSRLEPCLSRLKALKGSFGRNICILHGVRQHEREDGRSSLCCTVSLTISVGRQRATCLRQVFDAYAALLRYELPDFQVKARSELLMFQ